MVNETTRPTRRLRDRLSFRQARIAVIVSLFLGIVFSIGQIFADLHREQKAIAQKMEQILILSQSAAAEAAFTLDTQSARRVTAELIRQDFLIEVTLKSDLGELLARSKKEKTHGGKAVLAGVILGENIAKETDLFVSGRRESVGRLEICADSYQIAANFINRSVLVMLTGFCKNLIMAAILVIGFFFTLTKPFLSIIRQITSNRKEGLLTVPDGYEKTEFGELVYAFNDMLETLRQEKQELVRLTETINRKTESLHQEMNEREKLSSLLHAVLDGTSDAIFVKDLNGRYILANPSTCQAIGKDHQEIIGKTDRELFPLDSALVIEANDSKVIQSGVSLLQEEELTTAYGHTNWMASKAPLMDSQGTVTGVIGVSRNITEIKQAEKRKKQLKARLAEAQRIESIGRLAGGVAHDFNNILAVILGHAEMLQEMLGPRDNTAREGLSAIVQAALRSIDLTRQLLGFARKQPIDPVTIDLNRQISHMLQMLKRLIGENITIEWRPGRSRWLVRIDPSQLDQILVNLCINARDAIEDVGRIQIETANVSLTDEFCSSHSDAKPGEFVCLTVKDDGAGINADILPNIFEPFFTTKEVGRGTGLGLANVHGIVRQNNGFLTVESETERGTAFHLYFPRRTEAEEKQPAVQTRQTVPVGQETILLVEDQQNILEMAKTMLERLKYTVIPANSADEALTLFQENGQAIQLLLTDVVMPEMNGRMLAENLLQIKPELKVLYMSGYTADVIGRQGVLDKAIHFIQKPFSLKTLATGIREAMEA